MKPTKPEFEEGKSYKPLTKKFQRKIESFTCTNCNTSVAGNGYTNHCPECLYSKHVDINPGDPLAECGGLMAPVAYFKKNGKESLQHKCTKCGLIKNNKISINDKITNLTINFSLRNRT